MFPERNLPDVLRNLLQYGDLSFRDFVEVALYHPEHGYYSTGHQRIGTGGDFVTAPSLSPLFSFALGRLAREFVSRCEGELCSIVDIGCGDGALIRSLASGVPHERVRCFGVDRALSRVSDVAGVTFLTAIDQLPRDGAHLIVSNELFDAIPFARLVQRVGHLHELWVAERDGTLDWVEHEAPLQYEDYFAARGIELAAGQFADVSLEWGAFYEDIARLPLRGLVVTFDYGFPQSKLFHPRARRFGTAAAYSAHRVSRDLLANPGEQDLTAHINFTDLEAAGERQGARTLVFDRLAQFLIALGALEHEIFRPVEESGINSVNEGLEWLEARENARRLVLPDGIGDEMRVLVQAKGFGSEPWSFERKLV